MKRLAYLTVSSPITLKGLLTKPLKFVIQIVTGAPEPTTVPDGKFEESL